MGNVERSIGFVGGGRITSILLGALARRPEGFGGAVVGELDPEVRWKLEARFPGVTCGDDCTPPAHQDVVFIALHPPVLRKALPGIAEALGASSVVVSLAPVVTLSELSRLLGGFDRIARMIPNAPSLIGEGYNPTVFGPGFPEPERAALRDLFAAFGRCPEVEEEKLEAYAILTAMGPTYLWFQLEELRSLGMSFGLGDDEVRSGLAAMVYGSTRLLFESGRAFPEVQDTIPVKPLGEDEAGIVEAYRRRLVPLHRKLTGKVAP